MPLEIFCCYAHEDQALLKRLQSHLMPLQRSGTVTLWVDLEINAGSIWEEEIKVHLDRASIILLLISPDFMASDYCYSKEMMQALERQRSGKAQVVPVILRPVYWEGVLSQLQALPENGKPVTLWLNQDEAFLNIVEGIDKLARILIKNDTNASHKSIQHLERFNANSKQKQKFFSKIVRIAITIAIIILSISAGWMYIKTSQVAVLTKNPWQDYKDVTQQTAPTINDPLKNNTQGNGWSEETTESDTTFFDGDAYHVRVFQQGSYAYGCESQTRFDNVAFQVSMTMLLSDNSGSAGIVLGYGSDLEYTFLIDPNQNYEVDQINNATQTIQLAKGESSLIHRGYATSNQLATLKKNGIIELFINKTYLTSLPTTDDTSGYVGFIVRDTEGPFEATFQDFALWIID